MKNSIIYSYMKIIVPYKHWLNFPMILNYILNKIMTVSIIYFRDFKVFPKCGDCKNY